MAYGLGARIHRRSTCGVDRLRAAAFFLAAGLAAGCGTEGGGTAGSGIEAAPTRVWPRYEVVAVGPPGRPAAAHAVSDSGTVAGTFEDLVDPSTQRVLAPGRAFRWQGGPSVGELSGRVAWDVNGGGEVVGESGGVAYLWGQDEAVRALAYGSARAINDRGQVVGEALTTAGCAQAFLWQDGALAGLGALGGCWSAAYDINDAGQVVGWAETADGRVLAFRWEDGRMVGLEVPGRTSMAYGINDRGQAVGYATTADGEDRAFLAEPDGTLVDLGTLGGYSVAYGVDDAGRVVGESLTAGGRAHAFLWEGGRLMDLNDLVTPGSGWELDRAFALNDAGQIVGQGTLWGEKRAFLLTPCP